MSSNSRALTVSQVRSIRNQFNKGAAKTALADRYGVSARTIGRVVSGESYADVTQVPSSKSKSKR